MKALLAAIKAALLADEALGLRAQDCYVTPALEFIPNEVRAPFIALKDGDVTREELFSSALAETLSVQVCVFAHVLMPSASVMGDVPSGLRGVLDLCDAVHAVLDENLLGVSGLISAFCRSEGASETVGDEAEMYQRKILTYTYEYQGDR
jgi:hypothetical protein